MSKKYFRFTFDDIEIINNEDDYNKCLEDENYIKEVLKGEVKYLAQQGINILKVDYNQLYIVVENETLEFSNFHSNNITQSDEKGNTTNGYRDITSITIKNTKSKMIIDYLKEKGSKYFTQKEYYITFNCPICKDKTEQKCCISIHGFNTSTKSNTDCNNDKHKAIWEEWKKDLKLIWGNSQEKDKLIFSMNEGQIKKTIEKSFPPIFKNGNCLYYYNDSNFYSLVEETTETSDLDTFIYNSFINDNDCILNNKQLNDIKKYLKNGYRGFKYKEFQNEDLINFKNGVYDIKNNKLLDHSSNYFFTYILPCEYNQNLVNGRLEKIVADWGIDLLDIKKMLGYCFQKSNHLEKSFYLIGKPNCGKGTLTSMIKYMFAQKCESITIKDLYENHGASTIKDKTCLIDEDFDNKTFLNCDVKKFNKLISGESFNYNVKYKTIQNLNSTMKFIICANDYPRFKSENDNGGFRRRIYYMKFTSQYKQGVNQDVSIKQEFIKNNDMQSEFMNWVIEGLKLLNNNNPKEAFFDNQDELNEQIVRRSEPLIDYLIENVIVTNNKQDKIKGADLYNHFKNWCIDNAIDTKIGIITFNKKLGEVCNIPDEEINQPIKIDGKSVKGHRGIKLNDLNQLKFKVLKGEL